MAVEDFPAARTWTGRIVNFNMFDSALEQWDIAYPSWKLLASSTSKFLKVLEPTDLPSDAASTLYAWNDGTLSVRSFRKYRMYWGADSVERNSTFLYARVTQDGTNKKLFGFSREMCAWICAYAKAFYDIDCSWYVYVHGRADNSYDTQDHNCGFRKYFH